MSAVADDPVPSCKSSVLGAPDARGYYRCRVGGHRFTCGNSRDIGRSQAQDRADSIRTVYNAMQQTRYDEHFERIEITRLTAGHAWTPAPFLADTSWSGPWLDVARALASGNASRYDNRTAVDPEGASSSDERHVRNYFALQIALSGVEACSEELLLAQINAVSDGDNRVLQARIEDWADARSIGRPAALVENLSVPLDVRAERRSLADALFAFADDHERNGPRDAEDETLPSPGAKVVCKRARYLARHYTSNEVRLASLTTKSALGGVFTYWRKRPAKTRGHGRLGKTMANHYADTLWLALEWIDAETDWRWTLPRGASKIKRKAKTVRDTRTRKQTSQRRRSNSISLVTYTPAELAQLAGQCDTFGKAILAVCVNAGMQAAECGRLIGDEYFATYPDSPLQFEGCSKAFLIANRHKTGQSGEWLLWNETDALVKWLVHRATAYGNDYLFARSNGRPWYKAGGSNPAGKFTEWFSHERTGKSRQREGIVTRVRAKTPGFPRHPFKNIRKILPNHIRRMTKNADLADIANARRVDEDDRRGGRTVNRYADENFIDLFHAIAELRETFEPFLEALRGDPVARGEVGWTEEFDERELGYSKS